MAKPHDTLSIVIPLYNDERYIRASILSCVGEAGAVYVCDNASTDGSSEIVAELAERYPNLHHVRRASNVGAFDNMQKAIEDCTTPFLALVGSHDQLTPGYGNALVSAMQADSGVVLACGTIQHIDEQDRLLPNPTRADWINDTQNMTALDRVGIFVKKLRDCFLYYGVYRTEHLKAVWTYQPVLGFDRFLIIRMAARGKIAYYPSATFLARDFPATRGCKQDRERRVEVLTSGTVAKSNFTRNHEIAKTVLSLATNDAELTKAFAILDTLNRRLHNRRYFQRRRLAMIAGAVALAALFVFCLMGCI